MCLFDELVAQRASARSACRWQACTRGTTPTGEPGTVYAHDVRESLYWLFMDLAVVVRVLGVK
jgi:hypothetical protein